MTHRSGFPHIKLPAGTRPYSECRYPLHAGRNSTPCEELASVVGRIPWAHQQDQSGVNNTLGTPWPVFTFWMPFYLLGTVANAGHCRHLCWVLSHGLLSPPGHHQTAALPWRRPQLSIPQSHTVFGQTSALLIMPWVLSHPCL